MLKYTFITLAFAMSLPFTGITQNNNIKKAYEAAHLTPKQAAAHLLYRFTYGPKPGDVAKVVQMGIENWLITQLNGTENDDSLNSRLSEYDILKMSNKEIFANFPRPGAVLKMAEKAGIISANDINSKDDKKEAIKNLLKEKGLRPQQELLRQFVNQKILRACYSNNQLREIMTEFWFNHFNISATKNEAAIFIPNFERDVIRPNVFGKFENLLLQTAKSPAMLMYLDNFMSAGKNTQMPDFTNNEKAKNRLQQMLADDSTNTKANKRLTKLLETTQAKGLNENYAREIMELHTLGVDGGYTQADVTEAARVLTGWTVYPMGEEMYGGAIQKMLNRIDESSWQKWGFVHDGDFLFAANRHDNGEKKVLGVTFPANNGLTEGEKLIGLLANHPSTANFICKKIAIRFVSDTPSISLINAMVKTYNVSHGDIKQVLLTMVSQKEFWQPQALRQKTKSPFELAISTVRSLNAEVTLPYQLYNWCNKMGQKIYHYQAPTGFPDRAQYWINTGALLSRMNFGLAFANQKIPGIQFDLSALNNYHEPESAEQALLQYCSIMLPERDVHAAVDKLKPLIYANGLNQKLAAANNTKSDVDSSALMADEQMDNKHNKVDNHMLLQQIVGIIIGSPEFQRR